MGSAVSIDELSDKIVETVREFTDEVSARIPGIVEANAKGAMYDLRSNSPRSTGDYGKGWKLKKTYSREGFVGYLIHNATDYQLTHLLELGHANRDGGRTQAFPHIGPVADAWGMRLTEQLKAASGSA